MAITLERGAHASPEDGICLLEAVAFVAGEKFTDRPSCVSPILAAYGRELNDLLPDKQRQQLVPLIPKLIGTVDREADQRDGLRCAHWLVTHWLPAWLDLVPELADHAATLRAIPAPESWVDLEDWICLLVPASYPVTVTRHGVPPVSDQVFNPDLLNRVLSVGLTVRRDLGLGDMMLERWTPGERLYLGALHVGWIAPVPLGHDGMRVQEYRTAVLASAIAELPIPQIWHVIAASRLHAKSSQGRGEGSIQTQPA